MATITIEIDIDADGNVSVSPNPAVVSDGDTVRWHVSSNAHGGGAIRVNLPAGENSPFGNTDNRLQTGVEMPRRCNLLEPSTEAIHWPSGADSYGYDVEFSGSPVISSVRATLVKRESTHLQQPPFPDDVEAVYLVPANPPIARGAKLRAFPKIYPLPWWKRWFCRPYRHFWVNNCCCCCCDGKTPAPVVSQPSPGVVAAPRIVLSQGMLAVGGLFYLLITPQGQRCQFMVQWTATGGVGQLTVDLDLQERGSFRRLASGLGPVDRYVHVGERTTYVFRATVTDSRGQSSFDTLTVTCP